MVYYFTGRGTKAIAIGDVNNDHHLDLVVTHGSLENVGILLGTGDGNFSDQATYSTGDGSVPGSVVIRDFNRDSRMDLATADGYAHSIILLFGDTAGTFKSPITVSTGSRTAPASIVAGDFNSDGYEDIATILFFPNASGFFFLDSH